MLDKSAAEQGRLIGKGILSPLDLLHEYLAAISKHPHKEKIFTHVLENTSLSEAMKSEKRAKNGSRKSLLDGVPIAWKDLINFSNIPTCAGSKLLNQLPPSEDATVLKNAKKFGIVNLAKTHMTELAFSGLGINPITETPPNSINSKLVAGGSSSGSAVCTASRLASAAIGSDTGGSVRVPAAWNNLVGLKTTIGKLSMTGVIPLCPSFDTIGPITQTVEDSAYIFNILNGKQPKNFNTPSIKGKKFILDTSFLFSKIEITIQESIYRSISLMRKAGAKIEIMALDPIYQSIELAPNLFAPEAYGVWAHKIENNPDSMYPPILERFRSGKELKAHKLVDSWQKLKILRKKYLRLTDDFDAVIGPTTPILPPRIDRLISDSNYFAKKNLLALRNTRVANLLGLCSLTLPTEKDYCGLMILSPANTEQKLLRLGASIERIIAPK